MHPRLRASVVPRVYEPGSWETPSLQLVRDHYRRFFGVEGHELVWPVAGPGVEMRGFRVLALPPNLKTGLWCYASIGAFRAADVPPLEFFLLTPEETNRGVELVTMASFYHWRQKLGRNHTLPIGEPWLPGATCDAFLISTPYPLGPELEILALDELEEGHAHVLWLLPITQAERAFAVANGADALEARFETGGLRYWELARPSFA